MIGRRRILDEQEQDEFGPGSDLVLSMFAVSVLILAVVGVGWNVTDPCKPPPAGTVGSPAVTGSRGVCWQAEAETQRSRAETAEARAKDETARADSAYAALAAEQKTKGKTSPSAAAERQRADALALEVAEATKRAEAAEARANAATAAEKRLSANAATAMAAEKARADAAVAAAAADKTRADEAAAKAATEKTRADEATAAAAAEKARGDLAVADVADLGAQVKRLIAELSVRRGRDSMVVQRAAGREVVLAEDTIGSESFVPGGIELTAMGRARLRDRLALVGQWPESDETNVLLIEAREPIDPVRRAVERGAGDGALDLSALRALAVAQTVAIDYGVPFDCLSVMGRGRSRSEFLFRKDSVLPLPANTLAEFDRFISDGIRAGAQSSVPEVLRRLEPRRRRERIVVALAAYDPGVGSCSAGIIRRALATR